MVALSTRQHRIIDLLLERQQDITIAHIADVLGISSRTVHRELNSVEQYLKSFDIKLHKKSGSGIRIEGTDKQLALLLEQFRQKLPADMDAAERKVSVLCTLLEQQEPMKLFTLAHELNVTMPTVSGDLDDLESMIFLHQLQLIRRRGYGVELIGYERNKRKLIASLVTSYLDETQIVSYLHSEDTTQPIVNQLLGMIGKKTFQRIEAILWDIQEGQQELLKESTYTKLLIQMSIALTRFMRGHLLPERAGVDQSGAKLELSQSIIERLALQLPIEEEAYLEQLVNQAFEQDQEVSWYDEQPNITEIVAKLTKYVEQNMKEPITEDASLGEGLVRHMLPALKRIQEGEAIRNPMLSQIKKDYAQLFGIIAEQIEMLLPQINVPEEEIGYITMHYGAAIERLKQLPKQLKVVIVCTSGIGSSRLLAIRLEKEFPQIEQVGHYSWYEAARLPKSQYDFIISTVNLPLEATQYIRLSPLITDEEIIKLKQYMKSHVRHTTAATKSNLLQHKGNAEQWFQELQSFSKAALQIINPFEVYRFNVEDQFATIHKLLPELLLRLNQHGSMEDLASVTRQLLLREEQGSIVLPDTEIALLHARHDAIKVPILALFRMSMPIRLKDSEQQCVQHILLMLAPRQVEKHSLELLSEISAMLLLPELTQLLQHAETEEIKAFISTQLEKHIKQNWRD